MFQFLCFIMCFTQFLNCSSNQNNTKKVVKAEQKTSDRLTVTGYLIQNRVNSQNINNTKSAQNNDDHNIIANDNKTKKLSPFEKKEALDDFLEDLENFSFDQEEGLNKIETKEPINLSKKNRHSKLSFPNKDALEGKLNSQDLKEAKSKNTSKLDLKMFSALTVETQDLTKSGQISNVNESDSENVSTFNSYRSEKNDDFQKSKNHKL